MKTKIIISILIGITLSANSQNTTFFNGHVYTEDSVSEKQTMIPFATIKVSSINSPNKTIAVRIAGVNGSYDLKGLDTDSIYIVKVKAPDFAEQSFVTKPNNGRVKSGNLSAHLMLKAKPQYESTVKKQSFILSDISDDKQLSVVDMIGKIPELIIEDSEILTKKNGSVRLMINGFNHSPELYTKIKDLPASQVVKSMDYYDLSQAEGSVYDGVLNIHIKIGNEAASPDYKLVSLKAYTK